MKKLFLLSISMLLVFACSTDDTLSEGLAPAPVFIGDVQLKTQTAVDSFAAFGYGGITGLLALSDEFEPTDPIIDITELNTLTSVGELSLGGLDVLTSIQGLENIESISGNLILSNNPELLSLEPLRSISSEIEELFIRDLLSIQSLDGLENVRVISGGKLTIEGNASLENLDAIKNGLPSYLRAIRFSEYIFDCGPACDVFPAQIAFQPFTSFDFLENVTSVDGFRIRGFVGTEITGLQNLESVTFGLTVWLNPNLETLNGLENISSDIDNLFIADNENLQTLNGLENLTSVNGSITIWGNDVLSDLCALENNISSSLEITDMEILGNAYNPTIEDIMNGDCSL